MNSSQRWEVELKKKAGKAALQGPGSAGKEQVSEGWGEKEIGILLNAIGTVSFAA